LVSTIAVHDLPGAAPGAGADRERLAVWIAFAALAAVALALWVAYPVAPTFDSAWALVWGHQILAGHLPSFAAYRAPTEHPLWVAFGTLCAALGAAGPRAMTLVGVLSLLWVVAGLYRLGRAAFGVFAAVLACVLLLSRFHFAFYAEFAYLDVPYIGLLVWAAVFEAERPRRGGVVWVLLVLAGLLRPDAWLYLLCYAGWVGRGAPWKRRVRLLAIVAVPAIVWALLDLTVTGDPTFSFTFTTGHAEELARSKPPLQIPGAVLAGLLDLAKPPVLIGALAGVALAVRRLPLSRYAAPLALALGGVGSFVITSFAGFAVVNRYLALAAVALICFAGYLAAELLRVLTRRVRASRTLIAVTVAVLVAAGAWTAVHLHPAGAVSELRLRLDVESDVHSLLRAPAVTAGRRCGPISVPNHKLMPLIMLDLGQGSVADVLARSDSETTRARERGVAFVMQGGNRALYDNEYGPFGNDSHDPHSINGVPRGFRRVASLRYLAAYVRC
jgi:hypothetical protein